MGMPTIRRRYAGVTVTRSKTIAIVIGTIAAAASLAGCASAPPLSLAEQLGFDKATGSDITNVPPGLRMNGFDYPPPRQRYYRAPPPPPPDDQPPPDEQ
jgi:hypothetical protein